MTYTLNFSCVSSGLCKDFTYASYVPVPSKGDCIDARIFGKSGLKVVKKVRFEYANDYVDVYIEVENP